MTCLSVIVMASFAFFRRDFHKTKCYFLCNPTTKRVRCLPKSILSDSFVVKGAELSYDCNTDDYKFVVFGHNSAFHEPKAEIYSLRNDCWRDISFDRGDMFDYIKRASWYDDPQSIFNRAVLCWALYHGGEYSIISFDLADKLFDSLPLPSNLAELEYPWISLALLNESIALFHYTDFNEYHEVLSMTHIEVWMMDECSFRGVKGSWSWTKILSIDPLLDIPTRLMFWKDDVILMEEDDRRLISYNVRSQKMRILTDGVGVNDFKFVYVKSLVSVHGRRQQETPEEKNMNS